jgi:preprotein translocase subunit YajC
VEDPLSFAALSFQNVPPAPGRQTDAVTTAPSQPAPAGHASEPGFGGMLPILLMIVPFILLMMFQGRSQAKKQTALIASLQKGDKVLTQGGLVGKLLEVGDRYAKVEIAPGVKVDILKTGLIGKDTPENAAALEKKQ